MARFLLYALSAVTGGRSVGTLFKDHNFMNFDCKSRMGYATYSVQIEFGSERILRSLLRGMRANDEL